jgi:hypothetical protein
MIKTKRVIIDYTQNTDLKNKLAILEKYYSGLSKAEIVKLAIVELFREKIEPKVINLTDSEEKSLELAMKSKRNIKLKKGEKFSSLLK